MIPPILLFSVCSFFGRLDGFRCIRRHLGRHLGRWRFRVEQSGGEERIGGAREGPAPAMLRGNRTFNLVIKSRAEAIMTGCYDFG